MKIFLTFLMAILFASPCFAQSGYANGAGYDNGLGNSATQAAGWTLSGSTVFTTKGNVGIGTSTPQSLLSIYQPTGTTTLAVGNSVGRYSSLSLQQASVETAAFWDGGSPNVLNVQNSANAGINFKPTGTLIGAYLSAAGNLGIGTVTPLQALHVIGNVLASGSGTFNGTGASTISQGLNITSGNVGIGTSNPPTLLYVNGAGLMNLYLPGEESFSTASSITPTGLFKVSYMANSQGAATFTVNNPTNAPTIDGQTWILKISSTAVQTFSWGNQYVGGASGLPVSTLGTSTIQYYYFTWDTVKSKFDYQGTTGGF